MIIAFASLVATKRAVFVHIKHKLTLKLLKFVETVFNWFKVVFLEQLNVTQQGISFCHKVVHSVADGRSLR